MYKVINDFIDKQDNKTSYKKGDIYPRGDYEPTVERVEELSTVHPIQKRIFIESVVPVEDNVDPEEEEKKAIRAELESLGVSFHPNTGLEKLKEKLEEAKSELNKE